MQSRLTTASSGPSVPAAGEETAAGGGHGIWASVESSYSLRCPTEPVRASPISSVTGIDEMVRNRAWRRSPSGAATMTREGGERNPAGAEEVLSDEMASLKNLRSLASNHTAIISFLTPRLRMQENQVF